MTSSSDAKARALATLEERRGELAELCATLVRIPSENPPGDTREIAGFVSSWLRSRDIPAEIHAPQPTMPNLLARLGGGGRNLVLASHLDEFPAGEGWTFPPFAGAVEQGRIIGRGAGDMRAGMAISLMVCGILRELSSPLGGRITLVLASDEETGGRWGTQWLLEHIDAVRGDACLIGESSGTWAIGVGEKGVLWLRVKAAGVSGHAAYGLGESAVNKLLGALEVITRRHGVPVQAEPRIATLIDGQRQEAERHWGPGAGALADRIGVNIGTVRGGAQVNLIPDAAEAEVDIRLPPGIASDTLLMQIERDLQALGLQGMDVETFNQCDPYVTAPDERIVRALVDNARDVAGIQPLPVVRPGYTDGRFFRRAGIPTAVYGPSVHNMGGPDESVEEVEVYTVAKVHLAAVLDYLGGPDG